MGVVTSLIAAGIGVSAAVGYKQVREARKTRQNTERDMKRQETKANEAAKLDRTKDDTGAEIRLGTAEEDLVRSRRQRKRGIAEDRSFVGGLGLGPVTGGL